MDIKLKEKLASGEISKEEYDKLYQKFSDLDLLGSTVKSKAKPRANAWSFSGSSQSSGGEIDGPVISSGRLSVDGDLKCQRLSISGSINVNGDLTVIGRTSASGRVAVNGNSKFGGPVAINGDLALEGDLFATDNFTVSGKVNVDGDTNAGGILRVSGKFNSENFRSSSNVRISGKIMIKNDFIAKKIEASNGRSLVGGNLKGEEILISPNFQQAEIISDETIDELDDIEGLPNITKFITKMVTDFVPNVIDGLTNILSEKSIEMFEVEGNIEGKLIRIANTHVRGDILGSNIDIGPNVTVDGKVKYRDTVEIVDGVNVKTEKII
jgi:cytoskeletal protein CcmA (bactofilin family)